MVESDEDQLGKSLKKYWGYNEFRENQLEICQHILDGHDCFVVMATGSGKSLTFQLPAIALRDIGVRAVAIVVSPLISLIEDQVASLLSIGVKACSIGSTSSLDTELRAQHGEFTLIYATPEKLLMWSHGITELLKHARIVCLAIDESHCVSEWGHDFRPDYRRLGDIRAVVGTAVPVVALTASATKQVQTDIIRNLNLRSPYIASAPLNRPNLKYCVLPRTGVNDVLRLVFEFRKEQLANHKASLSSNIWNAQNQTHNETHNADSLPFYPTLIYVNTKKETEEIAAELVGSKMLSGVRVAFYHAGMTPKDRSAVHMAFSKDEIQIVIATIAFGMGINKPDVRLVVHFGMTKSLEAYYQQTGRAGRDGHPSKCVLLYNRQDIVKCYNIATRDMALTNGVNSSVHVTAGGKNDTSTALQRINQQLNTMNEFSTHANGCRRRFLLKYFDETIGLEGNELSDQCCDLCDDKLRAQQLQCQQIQQRQYQQGEVDMGNEEALRRGKALIESITSTLNSGSNSSSSSTSGGIDVSKDTYMLLRTVIDCGEIFGISLVIAILLGKHDQKTARVPSYTAVHFFGSGAHHNEAYWKALANQLTEVEHLLEAVLTRNKGNNMFTYQRYVVTAQGREYLAGRRVSAQNRSSMSGYVHSTSGSNSEFKQTFAAGGNYSMATALQQQQHNPYTSSSISKGSGGGSGGGSGNSIIPYDETVHRYVLTSPSKEFVAVHTFEQNRRLAYYGGGSSAVLSAKISSSSSNINNSSNDNSNVSSNSSGQRYGNNTMSTVVPIAIKSNSFHFLPTGMAFHKNTHSTSAPDGDDFLEHDLSARKSSVAADPVASKELLSSAQKVELELVLRSVRNSIASSTGMNPYNILSATDIQNLIKHLPTTVLELSGDDNQSEGGFIQQDKGQMIGWGEWKIVQFGATVCTEIAKYLTDHNIVKPVRVKKEVIAQQDKSLNADTTTYRGTQSSSSSNNGNGNFMFNRATNFAANASDLSFTSTASNTLSRRPSVALYRPNYDDSAVPAVSVATGSTSKTVSRSVSVGSAPLNNAPLHPLAPTNSTPLFGSTSYEHDKQRPEVSRDNLQHQQSSTAVATSTVFGLSPSAADSPTHITIVPSFSRAATADQNNSSNSDRRDYISGGGESAVFPQYNPNNNSSAVDATEAADTTLTVSQSNREDDTADEKPVVKNAGAAALKKRTQMAGMMGMMRGGNKIQRTNSASAAISSNSNKEL